MKKTKKAANASRRRFVKSAVISGPAAIGAAVLGQRTTSAKAQATPAAAALSPAQEKLKDVWEHGVLI